MRYREVKKGMKVKVYCSIDSDKRFIGKEGKVVDVDPRECIVTIFKVNVLLKGDAVPIPFSHKELKEVK